ncbi:Phosphotransferase enzyme family protein [Lentzea fradiae]|uniref:Phosphotransferase enzyme family protein n=1 Tax=Lentzea fradiae TaxID=200378 RepID=A0A1G7RM18_9PSEU|nr:phosphotransferase [Lentzea fradiae]SDG11735.1 Phosphotransferase enzyme family protein [Lentzea fradiae]
MTPDLRAWCASWPGSAPAEVFYSRTSLSSVHGVRLADGREVYVKAREDDGRAHSCLTAQAVLAERGFPCPRPITPIVRVGGLAVHAEAAIPGGEMLLGSTPSAARRYAEVFARLMAALAEVHVGPPLPNPRWSRWDHTDQGPWPSIGFLDARDQSERLLATRLPVVLGHLDFEAQNLRWHDGEVLAVHDWDSLGCQPEAAIAGAAGAAFANASPPGLVPVGSKGRSGCGWPVPGDFSEPCVTYGSGMSQPIPFADLNFKLAVVQELMYNQDLLPKFDLREYAAEQGFTYDDGSFEAVPEALAYFEALEVPAELAEKITEIEMDGGNEIYLEIAPNWDGEDNLFDIADYADVRHFPNLKSMTLFYSGNEETLEALRAKGIEADWL